MNNGSAYAEPLFIFILLIPIVFVFQGIVYFYVA